MSSDPHKGGRLEDMAEHGTTMPNDAGQHNIIRSVPRPDQTSENPQFDNEGIGEPNYQLAADNPRDMPRSTKDVGVSGEVITGTGDALPPEVESKRLNFGAQDAGAKGHLRDFHHEKHKKTAFERFAGEDMGLGDEEQMDQLRNPHS